MWGEKPRASSADIGGIWHKYRELTRLAKNGLGRRWGKLLVRRIKTLQLFFAVQSQKHRHV